MLIGILSDTHGHTGRACAAGRLFVQHQAQAVIHCGDIGGLAMLQALADILAPPRTPLHAVLGNVDLFDDALAAWQTPLVTIHGEWADLTLAGKRLAVLHGHDRQRLARTLAEGRHAYVLTGHTHEAVCRDHGSTVLINPGALYRTTAPSVALLDLATGTCQHHPLP
jgi:putative phosphoesterase